MNATLEESLREAAAQAGARWEGRLSEALSRLCEELLRWNERVRLVGYRSEELIYENLILEGLCLLEHLPQAGRVMDVGSGAGFPGLVLAAARETLQVTSIDAREKKIHFQQHAARLLGLSNFEARAQRLDPRAPDPALAQTFDVVTAQALAEPQVLIPWLSPYLRAGGALVLLQGPTWEKQRKSALALAAEQRLALEAEHRRELPLSGALRLSIILRKES